MAERLPGIGGRYVQMEDELASMAVILGAAWTGVKTMPATSGPGFALILENLGLGIITETPPHGRGHHRRGATAPLAARGADEGHDVGGTPLMTVEEAIQTSLQFENRVRDVYGEAAARAGDAVAKKMLRVMVGEEQRHVEYLEARLAE
jgi:hypothetical protein